MSFRCDGTIHPSQIRHCFEFKTFVWAASFPAAGLSRGPPPPLLQRKANNLHGLFVLAIAPTLYRRGRHKSALQPWPKSRLLLPRLSQGLATFWVAAARRSESRGTCTVRFLAELQWNWLPLLSEAFSPTPVLGERSAVLRRMPYLTQIRSQAPHSVSLRYHRQVLRGMEVAYCLSPARQ